MKKVLLLFVLLLGCSLAARSQVVLYGGIFTGQMSELNVEVLDSLTREPVPFASVYVIPRRDTTITNFTLTDTLGRATLKEVPYGNYTFFVEMLGYKTVRKVRNIHEWQLDMGKILLQEDPQYLDAARVSDIGNPVVIKQDTIEFNAASYRVGSNAVLRDLIKRMPGIEITPEGTVKMNGEAIDKITLGGRTFFFDDQAMALNNLPAQMVDKIRIIDRDSEQKRATGVEDGRKEKIMDVVVKKEYEKGWFGNLGLKGGTTLADKNQEDPMRDNRGLLYTGNVMASGYTEKDQLTLTVSGGNVVDDSEGVVVVVVNDGEGGSARYSNFGGAGLSTQAQAGVNLNTSRIKDTESTLSASYRYTDNLNGNRAYRTTYQDSGNLLSETAASARSFGNRARTDLEFKKEKGKVWFYFRPTFTFSQTSSFSDGSSHATNAAGLELNRSSRNSWSDANSLDGSVSGTLTIRELGGNPLRSLRIQLDGSLSGGKGSSSESSTTWMGGGAQFKDIGYANRQDAQYAALGFTYNEPLADKWLLTLNNTFSYRSSGNEKVAEDRISHLDDYFSSYSRVRNLIYSFQAYAQYNYSQRSSFSAGVNGTLQEQVNEARSFGVENTSGKGDWLFYLAPRIQWRHYNEGSNLYFTAQGNSTRPSQASMLPALNVSNPTSLSLGNVYLKPYFTVRPVISWNYSKPGSFSSVFLTFSGSLIQNPTVYARWYDTNGIMSSVPVNAHSPSISANLSLGGSFPFNEKKTLTGSLYISGGFSQTAGYQADGTLPALSAEGFNYNSFMSSFWGNESGDRFYGGASGFREILTRTFSGGLDAYLRLNLENFNGVFSLGTTPTFSSNVLYAGASPTTWDNYVGLELEYTTVHEFELSTDISYYFYNGYAPGYGYPEWQWNFSINKSIGAFVLSFSVHDILNQTKSLHRSASDNYIEDSYGLVMGRYGLFGVKWNFGKMNSAQSQKATRATLNMAL